jgi:hypothetical protein
MEGARVVEMLVYIFGPQEGKKLSRMWHEEEMSYLILVVWEEWNLVTSWVVPSCQECLIAKRTLDEGQCPVSEDGDSLVNT